MTILKNGLIIDPDKQFTSKQIRIVAGKIAASDSLEQDEQEIDLKGYYIAPGFIDGHVHVFENMAENGVHGDDIGIKQGVTTVIDAGSTGYNDFAVFESEIVNRNKTNTLALINVSKTGLVANLHELTDLANLMTVGEAIELFQAKGSLIKGLKVRLSSSVVGDNGVKPLEHARQIADQLGLPIMVHIGNPPPYLPEVFPLLKRGDIVTHAFHGKPTNGILDQQHNLLPEAQQAIERGVYFDIGHGSASFSFKIFELYLKRYSDYHFSCSTDLHIRNIDSPVGSLMLTLSKLLSFNIDLQELVETVTKIPRESFNLTHKGRLDLGSDADFTVFEVAEEELLVEDSLGEKRRLTRVLKPKMTILAGEIVWQAADY